MIYAILVTACFIMWIILALICREGGLWRLRTAVAFGIWAILIWCTVIDENFGRSSIYLQRWEARRAPLAYQVDDGEIDGALATAIGQFNDDLIARKARHENVWTSWLVGDYIENVDLIQLPKVKEKK